MVNWERFGVNWNVPNVSPLPVGRTVFYATYTDFVRESMPVMRPIIIIVVGTSCHDRKKKTYSVQDHTTMIIL